MKIVLGGALGRMGRETTAAAEAAGVTIVCGVDVAYAGQSTAYPVVTSYDQLRCEADALIDFSRPEGLPELLSYCVSHRTPAVLCTTGYTDRELEAIAEASRSVAILRSANMSLGVNVLRQLVSAAARALGDGFDIEIIEKHHHNKVDAPSGTALMLAQSAINARGPGLEPTYGRHGRTQKRAPGEIGIHAVRGGSVTGEHEVGFYGNGEQLILTHRAESRALFAEGALKAARFLAGKPAGMYDMSDVVDALMR